MQTHPPLTNECLLKWFQNNFKEKSEWKIGTEHELFVFDLKTNAPLQLEGEVSIQSLMREMAKFGWHPEFENGLITSMKRDNASLTLEPAGQFELSGAPFKTLHETAQELKKHFEEIKQAGDAIGAGFLPIGFHPTLPLEAMPCLPNKRHEIMKAHLPSVGKYGQDIMYQTCTVQVNLDYSSAQDMAAKMRVAMALQPIAIALWANSPYKQGIKTNYQSIRSHCWTDMDATRTGFLPQVMDEDYGFQDYIDYALNVPMCVIKKENEVLDASGLSFKDFINGDLSLYPEMKATLKDWEDHLASLYPEVRLKKIIEMRGADCGQLSMLIALPAFWVGLLYDEESLLNAHALIKNWTKDDVLSLYEQARATGLKGEGVKEITMLKLAKETVDIAKNGLIARGLEEEIYLAPLYKIIDTRKTQADVLIEAVEADSQQNPNCLFAHFKI